MAQLYNRLSRIFWALGIVSLVGGVVFKVVPAWGKRFDVSPHGILILAGVLFLSTLATREVGRTIS